MPLRTSAFLASSVLFVTSLAADPLTKQLDLDFGRDVASRNLKGLAARSDGRLLPGPVFTDLSGPKIGEILWTLKPAGANRFLVGTGPDGKVQEVTFNPKDSSYTVREVADVDETQAIALLPLADGGLLIGTSPTAALYLVRDGKIATRVPLPADSVFDLLALPDGTVLAATGNPGKIFRVDLKKFAGVGVIAGKVENDAQLSDRGITTFGEIRDRNVRRIARLADGSIVAGSAPKGNIYKFSLPQGGLTPEALAKGVAPIFLQENRDGEVVDLMPLPDGSFYAGIVFSAGDVFRLAKPGDTKDDTKDPTKDTFKDRDPKPAFGGRSTVVRFPPDGYPENLVGRPGISLYRLARHGDWLLLTAGEQGDTLGYDPVARRTLTFAGSASGQLNDLAPLDAGRFLVLRNNAPGLALMSFADAPVRELETKRVDLGQAADLGALRFPRLRGIDLRAIKIEASTNFGGDELEGWSAWTELKQADGAFSAAGLRGRYVRYRLHLPGGAADFQVDKGSQYYLPQNRRPNLADFRIFPPNQGLVLAAEQPVNVVSTVGQLLFPSSRDAKEDGPEKRKGTFLNSQVIPQPGTQIVYWAVNDPDGDSLAYTFSMRSEGADAWIDLAVRSTDSYVQFETGGLPEGYYQTRLVVAEQAPRPADQRLTYTFETEPLLVDHTAPVITSTDTKRANGSLLITATGRDALSLLEGVEIVLNNGTRDVTLHPADGQLDGREETFVVEFPEAKTSGATSAEIILYDQAGNATSTRVALK
ncbi:MAG TPA: hypothetical protein VG734_18055 [Lacunisphaera sp.]|nr:hypothetical protein [Lacunisphaera sp.]